MFRQSPNYKEDLSMLLTEQTAPEGYDHHEWFNLDKPKAPNPTEYCKTVLNELKKKLG
ncbi:hypothetical protein [Pseudodesulfovibrio sediminis]|uniref:Uncharacterized protein n=1 Tax=Pseudodesulfovibrio sediminis TaxID=2810563 RepID=A0ABM7P5W7_9BACT|nr:hypothetical protein [Pseudodesulfovibrio sediminis]BCS88324.1 hypothetical protein PSDVSF_15660 [Pseudodesulfovibrio sediminis]